MRLTNSQLKAADPRYTRLATANAGSGKTHVLVGRVSRLLLRNVAPENILCLTYTKAAAAEMQSRLFEALGKWSIMEDEALRSAIQNLYEEDISRLSPPLDIGLARQLFAKALETPEGLKVQTIHAFCERILSRFPIEAGIMPGFEPLDDEAQRDLKKDVERQVIIEAVGEESPELSEALQHLTSARADKTISSLFDWMAASPEKIRLWKASGGVNQLAKLLSIDSTVTPNEIVNQGWGSIAQSGFDGLIEALSMSYEASDAKRLSVVKLSLEQESAEQSFGILKSLAFKASDGKPLLKAYVNKTPDAAKLALDSLRAQIIDIEHQRRSAVTLQLTHAIYIVAVKYQEIYQAHKHSLRGLDFNDQILLVRDLLMRSETSDWVSYKLDGGIEHILVDEAQDTSPEQWQIIDRLAEPFFDGKGKDRDDKPNRTLFAVGDEKQSIYSFQGADPQQFLNKIQFYERLTNLGEVKMQRSFRSVQDVLNMVDRVLVEGGALRDMFPAEDYPPASDIPRHDAFRTDDGCVELWPVMPKPAVLEDKEPWDTTPVDAHNDNHQRVRLALQIAKTVKGWIENKEPIFDRRLGENRPMHAGDVLVLVQRRNSFFDAIIRQFKSEGVPVAGADRLKLKDSLIVKDLLSLTRFVLLPSDDLSLAEVLKSPLFGFDDKALFEVAVDRDGYLWDSLQIRCPDEAALLSEIMQDGLNLPPYDFYTVTLDRIVDGVSLRERLNKRLSMEAREALDAFLARALDHQYRRTSSLHHYVRDFASNDVEIKRDMDSAKGVARVMTVHGAKGLEAPVVFLPDTTSLPTDTAQLVPLNVPSDSHSFVWKPSAKEQPDVLKPVYEANKAKMMQEQLRLLYVAMTRAESRLIVCGYHNGVNKETGYVDEKKDQPYRSWYAWLKQAFDGLSVETFTLKNAVEGQGEALRYGRLPLKTDVKTTSNLAPNDVLPAWVSERAVPEKEVKPQSPSHLTHSPNRNRVGSKAVKTDGFLRGNIIHKLLEILPDFSSDRRDEIAKSILSKYRSLSAEQRSDILTEVTTVLGHPEYTDLFDGASMSEVSLTGTADSLPEDLWLNAQIDRLCVTDTAVLVVDYKSDRNPPEEAVDINERYLIQMAAYRALAQEIYPGRDVKCALLWTTKPELMPLPNTLLDEALQRLHALPKSELSF